MVSRATVYNTLNLLVKKGLLRQFVLTGGRVVFDANVSNHHHFIENDSGRIHDVPWEALRVENVERLSEFEVAEYQVVLRGRRKKRAGDPAELTSEKGAEIMTTIHPTRNDLPETARREMSSLLNAHLADGIDLALQAKQAHWNVKGPHFLPLHELFDKLYDEAAGVERSRGGARGAARRTAEGTLQMRLGEHPAQPLQGRAHQRKGPPRSAERRALRPTRDAPERGSTPRPAQATPTPRTSSPRFRGRPTRCSGSSSPTFEARSSLARSRREPGKRLETVQPARWYVHHSRRRRARAKNASPTRELSFPSRSPSADASFPRSEPGRTRNR